MQRQEYPSGWVAVTNFRKKAKGKAKGKTKKDTVYYDQEGNFYPSYPKAQEGGFGDA